MNNRESFLRYSMAAFFIIFGVLKFFPQFGPAEVIGCETGLTNSTSSMG